MNNRKRLLETIGMVMIDDGVLAAAAPRRHSLPWATSGRFRNLMRRFEARPQLVRGIGLVESAAGFWLARQQWARLWQKPVSRTHGHGHAHGDVGTSGARRGQARRRLAITLGLVVAYMGAEVIGGILANSLALLADAGHRLSDAGALALALIATRIAERPATTRHTYGYHRAEILAALAMAQPSWRLRW